MANGTYGEKRKAKAESYKQSLLKANPNKKAALDLMSTGQLIRKGKQASRVATKSIGLENQKNKQVLQNAKNELNKQDVSNVTSLIGGAREDLQNQQKLKMETQGYGTVKGKGDAKAQNINTALEQTKPLIDVDVEKGSGAPSSVNQNVNVNYNNSFENQNNSNKRAEENFTDKGLIGIAPRKTDIVTKNYPIGSPGFPTGSVKSIQGKIKT